MAQKRKAGGREVGDFQSPVEAWGFNLQLGAHSKYQFLAEVEDFNRHAEYVSHFRIGPPDRPEPKLRAIHRHTVSGPSVSILNLS